MNIPSIEGSRFRVTKYPFFQTDKSDKRGQIYFLTISVNNVPFYPFILSFNAKSGIHNV